MILSQIIKLNNLRTLKIRNLNASLKANIDILNTGLRHSNLTSLAI